MPLPSRWTARAGGAGALLVVLCLTVALLGASARAANEPIRVVALGDSLTAGLDLPPSDAFPARLERALKARGHNVEVTNAGVSGDTTAAGLERFDWAVPEETDAVILELGANDMLRGLDPKVARVNLERILAKLQKRKIPVLIAGMKALRNWGEPYVSAFDAIYPDLAGRYGAILYPFFLDGVAQEEKLNLKDGMHPNANGVAEIVTRILPSVEQLLARVAERSPAETKG